MTEVQAEDGTRGIGFCSIDTRGSGVFTAAVTELFSDLLVGGGSSAAKKNFCRWPTIYGLADYFYLRDIGRIWRIAEGLACGIVGVNTGLVANEMAPFGGDEQSGLGREGSRYFIEGYLEMRYVSLNGL